MTTVPASRVVIMRQEGKSLVGAASVSYPLSGGTPTPTPTVPGVIAGLTATPGNGQVALSFSAPSSGGAAIADYVYQYKLSSESTWTTFTDGASSAPGATITGLTNGQSYNFRAAAVNSVGQQPTWSNVATSTPASAATVPAVISGLTAASGDGQAVLTFSAPSNGGAAITDYVYQYKLAADSTWTTFADGTSGTTGATITGLTNGQSYDFRAAAVNSVGQQPTWSNIATATPVAPSGFTAGFTLSQFASSDTNRVFQRSSTAGGGSGKGAGTIRVPLSGTVTAGTVGARIRSAANGTTILQAEWNAGTISNGATYVDVPGVDARLDRFFVDLKGVDGAWQLGTVPVAMGDIFGIIGSSTPEKFFTNGTGVPNDALSEFDGGAWADASTTGSGAIALGNQIIADAGVAIGLMDYAVGGTTLAAWATSSNGNYTAFRDAIALVGGKLSGIVVHVGSNDARFESVPSQSDYETKYRALIANIRSEAGQPSLPVFIMGCQRAPLEPLSSDVHWGRARAAEYTLGQDSNVYMASTVVDLEMGGDNVHLSNDAMAVSGQRTARCIGAVNYGTGLEWRNPIILGATAVSATQTDLAIQHFGGTDFLPTSGITGFEVSIDDFATTLAVSAAARQNANTIRLTHASTGGAGVKVRYQWGTNPDVSSAVQDNGAAPRPLQPSPSPVEAAAAAGGNITIHDATSGFAGSNSTTGAGSTVAYSHTVTAGSNRVLIVAIGEEYTGTTAGEPTATYGGVGMTLAGSIVTSGESGWVRTSILYLLNPTVGTADLAITATVSTTKILAASCTLRGAKQQAPEAVVTGMTIDDGSSYSNLITTLTANAMVLDAVTLNNPDTPTAANGQTTASLTLGATGGHTIMLGAKEIATPGANTFGWNVSPNFGRITQVLAAFEVA